MNWIVKFIILKGEAEVARDMCEALYELFEDELKEREATGIAKGIAKGSAEERGRINDLNQRLLQEKRFADLEKSIKDETYQEKLLKEYDL